MASSSPITIMMLPVELREIIYNELPLSDARTAKRVCLQWRSEINGCYCFEDNINSRKQDWRKTLQLQMRSCVIDCLEEDNKDDKDGTAKWGDGQSERICVLQASDFKYLNKLERLVMTGSTQISSPLAVKILSSQIAESIRQLSLSLKLLANNDVPAAESLARTNFQNLQVLDLEVHAGIYNERCQQIMADSFVQLLSNPTLRSLKHLTLEVNLGLHSTGREGSTLQYLITIMKCLSCQSHQLESFTLNFCGEALVKDELNAFKVLSFSNVGCLKTLALSMAMYCEDYIFTDLLNHQKNLVNIELYNVGNQNVLNSVIRKNANTLESISIYNPSSYETIDYRIFESCNMLAKLKVD